ncbi:heterodisulfide reductase-related iron-sulfur binding cluster [Peribacillus butanolivorans]|uniref:heterodisulfide reductase-related iron-sulfur binding cluster n=1 Tax=Peribacillus butanolivorans TaxID=421767 RepID=UPI0037CAF763
MVNTANIHKKAEEVGLFYPPDPGSSNVATIGGNLLENEKMKDLKETQVATVITVNPGCQMQMSIGIQREGAAKRIKNTR